jgi:hypothetical protein
MGMDLYFLKEKSLNDLRQNLSGNMDFYSNTSPWLTDYFEGDGWKQKTKVSFNQPTLILGKEPTNDIENAIILYETLKHLTPSQASEERLWAYLTHTVCWDYMRSRWPIEESSGNQVMYLKNYYFFGSSPYINNGLARLWWSVYATVDPTRKDPYELTRYLFTNQIIFRELFKRNFTRNTHVLKTILSSLIDLEWLPKRNDILDMTRKLNQRAGIVILDLLSVEDIEELVMEIVVEIQQENAPVAIV